MSLGRPKATLELTSEEQQELAGFAASRSLPHAMVARARLVLWSAEGRTNSEIATRLRWSKPTVGKWRQRFIERRIQGLYDELRPGRPRSISDERVASLLRRTLKTKPPGGTHWSVRQAADENRLSKSTVHRVFQTFAVQPHRSKAFKLSTDPFFVEKVRDIVGLYLNPPDHAMVLAVDEKSQIQALSRTSRCCPWAWDIWRASRTITFVTAPPLCLPLWTSHPAPYSPTANRAIAIRSSSVFSSRSMRRFQTTWTCT
jgi:putative transposase